MRRTMRRGYTGTITNLQIVLNTTTPYLNQATQKNTCQKNPEIKNFKPQKILRSTMSIEIQSTPTAGYDIMCQQEKYQLLEQIFLLFLI